MSGGKGAFTCEILRERCDFGSTKEQTHFSAVDENRNGEIIAVGFFSLLLINTKTYTHIPERHGSGNGVMKEKERKSGRKEEAAALWCSLAKKNRAPEQYH
jgi:hypothetical protein